MWPARLYNSLHYLKKAPFKKKVTEHKMRVLISLQHLSDTFLTLRGIARKK